MRVGVLQPNTILGDPDGNLTKSVLMLEDMADCDLIVLPLAFQEGDDPGARAEVVEGFTGSILRNLAQSLATTIIAPLFEKTDAADFLTIALWTPDGQTGVYRVINLPDWGRMRFQAGTELGVFEVGGTRFGACSGGDLDDEVAVTMLRASGVQVIAACGTDSDGWLEKVRYLANANQIFFVAANMSKGDEGGGSCIVSPSGEVLGLVEGEEGFAIAEIHPAAIIPVPPSPYLEIEPNEDPKPLDDENLYEDEPLEL